MDVLKKSYQFTIPAKKQNLSVDEIFSSWREGDSFDEIYLLETRSKDQALYRYKISRGPTIHIELTKQEKVLSVTIKQKLSGLILPIAFFTGGACCFYKNDPYLTKVFFIAGFCFLLAYQMVFLWSLYDVRVKLKNVLY